jgi:dipeptidyl aminopeptidase/acylaminoacyl peptidase
MPRIARLVTVLISSVAACFGIHPVAADEPPPVEAFGTLPVETDVVLSSDGHYLAWFDHHETKPRVVIFDLLEKKVQRLLQSPEDLKLRSLAWARDNATLILVLSKTSRSLTALETSLERFRYLAFDASGGPGRILPDRRDFSSRLVSLRGSKNNTVVMSSRGACHDADVDCLIEVDTHTGKYTVIKAGNDLTTRFVVNRTGHAVAREDWDFLHNAYRVLALTDDGGIKELLRRDDKEHPQLEGLLADGSALVLLTANGHSHRGAWALPLNGSPLELLAESPDADVESVYTDPYTGAIIGVYLSGAKTRIHWLDEGSKHRHDVLQRAFADKEVGIYGWTEDGTKTLALVETPSSPPVYYIVDFKTHRADIAAEEYPALANVKLGEVKAITYQARDGTQIPAYLTMPAGKTEGPFPTVILPHGGPTARDYFRFDWLVQFLATRGYAVLQPQFRGSTGFGDAFREAGYRQWGGLMQDDVTDGVHAMIDQKIADPHKICIVGASYGGYAALAGAAFTPDLYACAVSINGVSDLPALLSETVPLLFGASSTSLADWKAHVGAPGDPNLAAKSPIKFAKAFKAPVLIVYGTGDGVVPNEQSERMARALKSAQKTVLVSTLTGEDHWLSRTETRTQVLKELDTFLQQNLSPAP